VRYVVAKRQAANGRATMSAVIDSVVRDLRYSLRSLRRRPGFAAAAVLTLALGIGANTAIFSVVNAVLIKPLPYPNGDELVSLKHLTPGLGADSEVSMSATMYFTYRDESRTLRNIGLYGNGGTTITGIGEPEQARALFVTYGVLPALGVQPLLGRWFAESDEAPGAQGAEPVMITYPYWQRRFGGDRAVIGRSITTDGRSGQVVGVMPKGFRFLDMTPEAEVILVQHMDRNRITLGNFGLGGIAQLAPGATLAEASADVERMLPVWLDSWPPGPGGMTREALSQWRLTPMLRPLKDFVIGGVANLLWVLMGTIGAVLLIACANVANLMLVRADGRRQELAIRSALGAGRGRIARELLVESLVLGALGGVLGLALAFVGLKVLVALGPASLPRLQEITVDPWVLAFAVGAALGSSLLFGSIPALKHASAVGAPLAGGGAGTRGATTSRERHRTRNALVVVQVALALVLLVSSGLMIRTFVALRSVDPGFTSPATLQGARIWVPPSVTNDPDVFLRTQRDILDKIAAIPGVTAAAFGFGLPMEGRNIWSSLFVEDRPYAAGEAPPARRFKLVSPGYLATLGTRLVTGRDITWADVDTGGKVAVLSENIARELFGSPAAALGKRISDMPPGPNAVWREIVGVTQDVREDALDAAAPPLVYWPVHMDGYGGSAKFGVPAINYAIRTERAGTESLLGEVRQAVWSSNPDLPVFLTRTLQDLYADTLARTSFALVMLAIAGAMALGLGVIGIYGVMAYVVSQRTREIGIRLALGAQPAALRRMFVKHGLFLATLGVAGGLVAAAALTRLMTSLLFEIDPLDPATYAAGLAVILTAAALASYLPARRAAKIDPAVTLKAE
jgi:predicted permease